MNKKILLTMLGALCAFSSVHARAYFDTANDLFLAQFDSKPDEDDIHSQAALGCMLAHRSFSDVHYYAVAGAYGIQSGTFIDSSALFNLAFGPENEKWTSAHDDWAASVTRVKNEAKAVLQAGGRVWVQEAGQSNFTADWLAALISDGIAESVIKSNVIVVQHSTWNEGKTSAADLTYVKATATYVKIDDGNTDPDTGAFWTPNFKTTTTSYLDEAKSSPNASANALWTEADRVCDETTASWENPAISGGGVDYSDVVEDWWIFYDEADVDDIASFWAKYVMNTTASSAPIGKMIWFKAHANGLYVCADKLLGSEVPLAANRAAPGAWELFTVMDAGDGLVGLKANANSQSVCADLLLGTDVPLAANRSGIGAWETFTWIENSDGTISLLAHSNGKYVCADLKLGAEVPVVANRTAIGAWEKFTWGEY